mmetsp:Transcript_22215/g.31018  ORF Transcript_22215/g.31018 Transcript_22215/m.31018 type:complete len:402 (+) Transcript_22215:422-1627(+)
MGISSNSKEEIKIVQIRKKACYCYLQLNKRDLRYLIDAKVKVDVDNVKSLADAQKLISRIGHMYVRKAHFGALLTLTAKSSASSQLQLSSMKASLTMKAKNVAGKAEAKASIESQSGHKFEEKKMECHVRALGGDSQHALSGNTKEWLRSAKEEPEIIDAEFGPISDLAVEGSSAQKWIIEALKYVGLPLSHMYEIIEWRLFNTKGDKKWDHAVDGMSVDKTYRNPRESTHISFHHYGWSDKMQKLEYNQSRLFFQKATRGQQKGLRIVGLAMFIGCADGDKMWHKIGNVTDGDGLNNVVMKGRSWYPPEKNSRLSWLRVYTSSKESEIPALGLVGVQVEMATMGKNDWVAYENKGSPAIGKKLKSQFLAQLFTFHTESWRNDKNCPSYARYNFYFVQLPE